MVFLTCIVWKQRSKLTFLINNTQAILTQNNNLPRNTKNNNNSSKENISEQSNKNSKNPRKRSCEDDESGIVEGAFKVGKNGNQLKMSREIKRPVEVHLQYPRLYAVPQTSTFFTLTCLKH